MKRGSRYTTEISGRRKFEVERVAGKRSGGGMQFGIFQEGLYGLSTMHEVEHSKR